MDDLFAQPTQPASAPRVRAFAELALNEIRSGVGGDASLLADKQAFSEFMDRVNESVLLGRREPPSAASILRDTQDCSRGGDEDSVDPPAPANVASMGSPASSLQPSNASSSGTNSGPSAVATHLEALSSKLAFSPTRRNRRQRNDSASDPGQPARPQQPPEGRAGSHRVRFDVCNEATGARSPEPPQYREHGPDFVQEEGRGPGREQNENADNEASLSSGDLAGPSLLQDLRRWRSEATAEINTSADSNRPAVPDLPQASISDRPSSHPSWSSPLLGSSQRQRTSPPSPPVLHRGDNVPARGRGTPSSLTASDRANQTNAPAETQQLRASRRAGGWRGRGDGERRGVPQSDGAGVETTPRGAEEPNDEPNPGGDARRVAQGSGPRNLPASDRQRVDSGLVDGAGVTSAVRRWREVDSKGHGKGMLIGGVQGPHEAGRAAEEGEQEKGGAAELSLDLSDCSDEKIAFLRLVRRNGAPMDSVALVAYVYQAADDLVKRCELVKQCHSESTRIAVRVLRTMGSLEEASGEFSPTVAFSASLIELKRVIEQAQELVKRCQRPKGMFSSIRAVARVNANKAELVEVEAELKRITDDLQIPMLADIRRAVQGVQDREVGEVIDEKGLQQAVQETIHKEFDARASEDRKSVREVVSEKGKVMSRLGRVRFDELEEDEDILGEGTFGVVQSGEYMGQEVAIKKARGIIGDPAVLHEFRREAETHFAMRHENIVRLIAFSEGSPQHPPCMVMERMEESLSSFLGTVKIPPPVGHRLETIKDMCQGLLFLHQHRITHCDVKSPNVLLDQAGTAKLSDFGLAVVEATLGRSTASYAPSSTAHNKGAKVGSEQYMAPEIHGGKKPTFASDVFSLHVVMWEVLTHQTVGLGTSIGERLLRSPDARLLIGDSVPAEHHEGIQALLDQCGRLNGKERPPMEGVLRTVDSLLQRVKDIPCSADATKTTPEVSQSKPAGQGNGDDSTMDFHEPSNQRSVPPPPAYSEPGAQGMGDQSTVGDEGTMSSREPSTQTSLPPPPAYSGPGAQGKGDESTVGDEGTVGSREPSNQASVPPPPAYSDLGGQGKGEESTVGDEGTTGDEGSMDSPEPSNQASVPPPPVHDAKSDRNALVEIYETTNGPTTEGWKSRHGWATSSPVGGWHGVSVDVKRRVITLVLRGNKLQGPIPAAMFELTAVTLLDLSNNELSGPIPSAISGMTAVLSLDLSNNQLYDMIPEALGGMTALQVLDLSKNRLRGSIPSALSGLTAMTVLNLSANQLSDLIPASLGRMTALRVLDLSKNRLSGPIPSTLGGPPGITALNLSENLLSGKIPPTLGMLSAMRTLDLAKNKLQGPTPPAIFELKVLVSLYLEDNKPNDGAAPVDTRSDSALERCVLWLLFETSGGRSWKENKGWATSAPLGEWHGVTVNDEGLVTELDLEANNLTGTVPWALGKLTSATSFDLSSNDIVEWGPAPVDAKDLAARDRLALMVLFIATGGDSWKNNQGWMTPAPVDEWYGVTVGDDDRVVKLKVGGMFFGNKLKGPLPSELGWLTALTSLKLGSNKLTGPIPPELGNLTALKFLWLADNKLTGPIPSELGGMTSLKELWISNNKLTGPIPPELVGMTALEEIRIGVNKITTKKDELKVMFPRCGIIST